MGIPILVRSLDTQGAPAVSSHDISITGNTLSNSDTQSDKYVTGLLQLAGDVHDFEIRGNTFTDSDSLGVETAGNRYGHEHAARGVISDNVFDGVGQTSFLGPTYAIYLQATEQILWSATSSPPAASAWA